MKKLLCCMMAAIVFLLSPLSAFASTTESMMMYSVGTRSIPSNRLVQLSSGYYNIDTDSWVFGTSTNLVDGATATQGQYYAVTFNNYDSNKIFPAYKIRLQNESSGLGLGYSYLYSFRLLMNDVSTVVHFGQGGQNQLTLDSNAVPLNAIYKAQMSISYYDDDGTIDQTTRVFTGNLNYSLSDFGYNANMDNYNFPYTLDVSLDKVDLSEYKVRGASYEWIEFYICFPLNNGTFTKTLPTSTSVIPGTLTTFITQTSVSGSANNPSSISFIATMDYQSSDSTNSLVSNGFKNVSNTISQVKTQLTQTTNTISTKIDSMGTNIQNGLTNVKSSIDTGISNIQSTITTKTNEIKTTITTKVDELKTGITQVKDSILDLPDKIQDMLLGLIVPDSDTMANKYSEFSGLLEQKLGIIYQIPMMLFDFFDTIVNAATTPQSSLTLPAFELPWIDGSTLTVWNSMEYKIIPDGLEVLSDLIKTVTSMTVVVLTFNSVKRAYERFLRS